MKKLIVILILLPLVIIAVDQVFITSPGSGGMVSNYDVQEIPENASYYSKNVDIKTTPGLIQRRRGLVAFGSNADTVYGATGYFEPYNKQKMIVGVSGSDSLELYTFRSRSYNTTSHAWTWGERASLTIDANDIGQVMCSDTFGLSLAPVDTMSTINDIARYPYSRAGGYHDFTPYYGWMISADGMVPPYAFTTRQTFRRAGSESQATPYKDTLGFQTRAVPIGLPAPGQLSVFPLSFLAESALTGRYQWAYSFGENDTIANDTLYSAQGVASNIVTIDNQYVYLTGFLHRPYPITDSVDTLDYNRDATLISTGFAPATIIRLARKDVDAGSWTFVDSFWVHPDSCVAYIDSGQGGTVKIDTAYVDTTIAPPGSIVKYAMTDYAGFSSSAAFPDWWANYDSTYYFRYSWYDPVLDIESPLGPQYPSVVVDSTGSGPETYHNSFATFINIISEAPTDWIRLYRNLTDGGLLGGGDTTIWYCMGQYRVDRRMTNSYTDPARLGSVWMGIYSDSQLAAGTVPEDSQLARFHYSEENVASDDDGAIVRPPYRFGIMFAPSDIAYANGRLWGIGDEIYPQRLYYSKFDDMGDWSPIDYLSLSEDDNDELVAIEAIGDVLYAFKHNSIFAITGTDAEYDLQFQTVTQRTGALGRFSIIRYNDEIFWLAPNMKIYSSAEFKEISGPIENYIDSLFTNYHTAQDSVRAFALTGKVCWVQINSGEAIAFDLDSRAWSLESYSNYIPYGTFQYDTLVNVRGFGENSWLAYRADTAQSFMVEQSDGQDSLSAYSNFTWRYQTPFIGDGVNQWMIPYVEFTATADESTYVVVTVFNEDSDSLVVDSTIMSSTSETTYRIGLPRHSGQYLSVRFRDNGGIKLSSVSVGRRRVGRARIK